MGPSKKRKALTSDDTLARPAPKKRIDTRQSRSWGVSVGKLEATVDVPIEVLFVVWHTCRT